MIIIHAFDLLKLMFTSLPCSVLFYRKFSLRHVKRVIDVVLNVRSECKTGRSPLILKRIQVLCYDDAKFYRSKLKKKEVFFILYKINALKSGCNSLFHCEILFTILRILLGHLCTVSAVKRLPVLIVSVGVQLQVFYHVMQSKHMD